MPELTRNLVMSVPQHKIFAAVTQFENYPKFLSEVTAAKQSTTSDPKKFRVDFNLEIVKTFKYALEFHVASENEVTWRLLESDFFKKNEGAWRFKAAGDKTEVGYDLKVEFGFMVPGFIAKKLTEVSLPKMFEAFEGQARKL